jgi:hypothetical protein
VKLQEIADKLKLKCLTPGLAPKDGADVSLGYVSDLLSDVLAHTPADSLLVTIQVHMNVIAVSVHTELAAVAFASGRTPDDTVIKKAIEEGVPLYVSDLCSFDLVGQLYALGIRGPHA